MKGSESSSYYEQVQVKFANNIYVYNVELEINVWLRTHLGISFVVNFLDPQAEGFSFAT